MAKDATADREAVPWMGSDRERVLAALAAPEGAPDRAEVFRYLGWSAASLAAEAYGDGMFGAATPRRVVLDIIRRVTRDNFRGVAEQLGADAGRREAISEAVTLGWLKFKQALRRAEGEGATGRAEASERTLEILEATYDR